MPYKCTNLILCMTSKYKSNICVYSLDAKCTIFLNCQYYFMLISFKYLDVHILENFAISIAIELSVPSQNKIKLVEESYDMIKCMNYN